VSARRRTATSATQNRRTIDILAKAPGIKLVAIFSPEHGATGELDINSVGDSVDRATGVHIYSIYGDTKASRHPPESTLRKLDVLVIDIQDIQPGERKSLGESYLRAQGTPQIAGGTSQKQAIPESMQPFRACLYHQ